MTASRAATSDAADAARNPALSGPTISSRTAPRGSSPTRRSATRSPTMSGGPGCTCRLPTRAAAAGSRNTRRCRNWRARPCSGPTSTCALDVLGHEIVGVMPDLQQEFSQIGSSLVRVRFVMSERLFDQRAAHAGARGRTQPPRHPVRQALHRDLAARRHRRPVRRRRRPHGRAARRRARCHRRQYRARGARRLPPASAARVRRRCACTGNCRNCARCFTASSRG